MKLSLGLLMYIFVNICFASPGSNCYQISNKDQKNFCLATSKNEKSYCYQISEKDQKNLCLALASHTKSYCYQISNNDNKNYCLGQF
jgi:hypothetical protein